MLMFVVITMLPQVNDIDFITANGKSKCISKVLYNGQELIMINNTPSCMPLSMIKKKYEEKPKKD